MCGRSTSAWRHGGRRVLIIISTRRLHVCSPSLLPSLPLSSFPSPPSIRPSLPLYPGASIRIPRFTARDNKGYLEDRRPASNIDPYLVTSLIFDTTCLKGDTKVPPGKSFRGRSWVCSCWFWVKGIGLV